MLAALQAWHALRADVCAPRRRSAPARHGRARADRAPGRPARRPQRRTRRAFPFPARRRRRPTAAPRALDAPRRDAIGGQYRARRDTRARAGVAKRDALAFELVRPRRCARAWRQPDADLRGTDRRSRRTWLCGPSFLKAPRAGHRFGDHIGLGKPGIDAMGVHIDDIGDCARAGPGRGDQPRRPAHARIVAAMQARADG